MLMRKRTSPPALVVDDTDVERAPVRDRSSRSRSPDAHPVTESPRRGQDWIDDEPPRHSPVHAGRAALMTFAALEGVALVFYMWIGRGLYFWGDEWDFLSTRTGGDLGDLFRPHVVHLSTLPILAYRSLWWVARLRVYWPYRLLLVLVHLAGALLLWLVMRRAGVRPWTATVVASVFVFFGSGYHNILWPFQIGLVGSLVFGVAQLLLADHDGPIDRRDWI